MAILSAVRGFQVFQKDNKGFVKSHDNWAIAIAILVYIIFAPLAIFSEIIKSIVREDIAKKGK